MEWELYNLLNRIDEHQENLAKHLENIKALEKKLLELNELYYPTKLQFYNQVCSDIKFQNSQLT